MLTRLLFCCLAEIVLGGPVSDDQIAQAKSVLAKAEARTTVVLQVGEFEVVRPSEQNSKPLLIASTDEQVCQTIEVAAGQPFACWMRKRGEDAPKLHYFPPAKTNWVVLVGVGQGQAAILVIAAGENQGPPVILERVAIQVGPRPPPPPTPTPQPQPPAPPAPPAPLPGQGLRVVIIYESSARLPPEQGVILTSRILRDRINAYQGKIRVLDQDTDVSRDEPFVVEALKLPRQGLPWIIISNGGQTFSGPLPATVADTLQLIDKYKG